MCWEVGHVRGLTTRKGLYLRAAKLGLRFVQSAVKSSIARANVKLLTGSGTSPLALAPTHQRDGFLLVTRKAALLRT